MKAIKNFDDFIRSGVVKIQAQDRPRADFLIKEAEQSYGSLLESLNKIKDDTIENILVNAGLPKVRHLHRHETVKMFNNS